MSIERRVSALEQQTTAGLGVRRFSTHDGQVYLEMTDCVFDHRHAIIGADGWPSFVKDRLMSREQVEQLEREGWQVSIVRW